MAHRQKHSTTPNVSLLQPRTLLVPRKTEQIYSIIDPKTRWWGEVVSSFVPACLVFFSMIGNMVPFCDHFLHRPSAGVSIKRFFPALSLNLFAPDLLLLLEDRRCPRRQRQQECQEQEHKQQQQQQRQ